MSGDMLNNLLNSVSDLHNYVYDRVYSLYITCGFGTPLLRGIEAMLRMARTTLLSALAYESTDIMKHVYVYVNSLRTALKKALDKCLDENKITRSEYESELNIIDQYIIQLHNVISEAVASVSTSDKTIEIKE